MDQRELMEQVQTLVSDNPAKFIKIRDAFDDIFEDRVFKNAESISDREFERIRYKFRDIDVPLSWCINKEAIYQLQKAISYHRRPSRTEQDSTAKKTAKSKKKGIFGIFR